jgi:hypothetical protein
MTWTGAQLYKSADASNYEAVLSSTSGTIIGSAQDALGDFSGGNVFDYENTVTITLQTTGSLTSYTQLQVLNGAGAFMLGAHGRWEVVQYKTATLVSAGVYTLSGLLRGRRGTEWAQGLHQVGDRFVLANVSTWQRPNPGTAEIGLSRYFKAVTFRDSLSNTTAQTFANGAVGLKPYAPVHLAGQRDGSNNLTINWVRRTRIGGEWRDYVDVQVGEATLAFDVEVWNSDYSTLIRTISGVNNVTTDYTAADQTTDGITPGDPVYLRIYQISAVVGRGYALEGTV